PPSPLAYERGHALPDAAGPFGGSVASPGLSGPSQRALAGPGWPRSGLGPGGLAAEDLAGDRHPPASNGSDGVSAHDRRLARLLPAPGPGDAPSGRDTVQLENHPALADHHGPGPGDPAAGDVWHRPDAVQPIRRRLRGDPGHALLRGRHPDPPVLPGSAANRDGRPGRLRAGAAAPAP